MRFQRTILITIMMLTLLVGSTALAQATVQVEIRPSDGASLSGQVTLISRAEGGASYQCAVQNNRCQISGVAGGLYTARFAPAGGRATSRSVAVGGSGSVRLVIPVDR